MSASVQGHTGRLFEPIYPLQHLDLQWGYFLRSEVFFKYHECLPCCREIDRGPWEQWPEKQEQFAYQSKVTESQSREERMEICEAHTRERLEKWDRGLIERLAMLQSLVGTWRAPENWIEDRSRVGRVRGMLWENEPAAGELRGVWMSNVIDVHNNVFYFILFF